MFNDDVLKGRGIVPSWLTGKLSDVAFLVVAPIVLAALLPARLPARRSLAVGSVTALFIATDLSPRISDAVVAFAARLGLHWRLWPDPTDLLALVVLPLTMRILQSSTAATPTQPGALVLRERLGLVIGALACLATSASPKYLHHPFLVNQTNSSVDLTVTWLLRRVDCRTSAQDLAQRIVPGDLDDPRIVSVPSGEVVVLDGAPAPGESVVGTCHAEESASESDQCIAAILETNDTNAVVMIATPSWFESSNAPLFSCSSTSSDPVSKCAPDFGTKGNPGADAISLFALRGQLKFRGKLDTASFDDAGTPEESHAVRIAPVDPTAIAMRAPNASDCRAMRDSIRALRDMTSCAVDADCQSLVIPVLPGDDARESCNAFVNRTISPDDAHALVAAFTQACTTDGVDCSLPQPTVCLAGTCAAACPSVMLAQCAPPCAAPSGSDDAGTSCEPGALCADEGGDLCGCDKGALVCATLPRVEGCPFACAPRVDSKPTTMQSDADAGGTSAP